MSVRGTHGFIGTGVIQKSTKEFSLRDPDGYYLTIIALGAGALLTVPRDSFGLDTRQNRDSGSQYPNANPVPLRGSLAP
jgi:hypothetical protein